MDRQLEEIRDWAKAKVASGIEPPWAWFQYMKLIETVEAILGSQASVVTTESSPQPAQRPTPQLQLVGSISRPDNAPHPPDIPQLPMPM